MRYRIVDVEEVARGVAERQEGHDRLLAEPPVEVRAGNLGAVDHVVVGEHHTCVEERKRENIKLNPLMPNR